jgi:hypothetical protein
MWKLLELLLFIFENNTVKCFVQSHIFARHRHTGAPLRNIQATLRTVPELCKNVLLQYYLVATVIHTQSSRVTFVYMFTYSSSIEKLVGLQECKNGTTVNAA